LVAAAYFSRIRNSRKVNRSASEANILEPDFAVEAACFPEFHDFDDGN
jgi:hypothetical protein